MTITTSLDQKEKRKKDDTNIIGHQKIRYWIFVLQTEKVDLENTVVDESQRQWKDVGPSTRLRQDKYSGMARFVFVFVLLWYILFQIVAIGKTESRLSYFCFVLRFPIFQYSIKCYSICFPFYMTLSPASLLQKNSKFLYLETNQLQIFHFTVNDTLL